MSVLVPTPARPRPDQVALGLLLAGTAALYTVGLSRSGWGNAFYAGAAQAGAASWRAWFFGASDAPGAITVDKPPAALWVLGGSVRLFGLSSWSLLVPQALMGVFAVAVLTSTVRRVLGPWPGLLAGLLLAVTPVATLMFRFDNPDALLTLLGVLAAWAVTRSLEDGRTRWLLLAGVCVGAGFLTKSLQAFLVLPGLAGAHLVAGPQRLPHRVGQLLLAGLAVLLSAGWWVAAVLLVPRADRPWVGGTADDDPLSQALGFNGLGRLDGDESAGGVGFRRAGESIWRLFTAAGDQAGWLLPLALVAVVAGLLLTARAPRTDPVRGAVLLWGGWLVVVGVVLSVMRGIEHSYYAVQLAPAVAALVAIGGTLAWRRTGPAARVGLAVAVAVGGSWSAGVVLDHADRPDLAVGTGALAVAAAVLLLGRRRVWVAGLTVLALCLGPLAWSLGTAAAAHTGSDVVATAPPAGAAGWARAATVFAGATPTALATIRAGAAGYTWAAATTGHTGATIQLEVGAPVMDIGGFAGEDPSITLPQFEADVAAHRIHYYLVGLGGGPDAVAVRAWVQVHATQVPAGTSRLYDLSALTGDGQGAGTSSATHSTCAVIGKASKARSPATVQPASANTATSRARDAGSQAT